MLKRTTFFNVYILFGFHPSLKVELLIPFNSNKRCNIGRFVRYSKEIYFETNGDRLMINSIESKDMSNKIVVKDHSMGAEVNEQLRLYRTCDFVQ